MDIKQVVRLLVNLDNVYSSICKDREEAQLRRRLAHPHITKVFDAAIRCGWLSATEKMALSDEENTTVSAYHAGVRVLAHLCGGNNPNQERDLASLIEGAKILNIK